MATKRSKLLTKFFALLDRVEETQDTQAALELCQMFINKEVSAPKPIKDGELRYFPKSKLRNKCCVCGKYYEKDAPCFARDGKGWHEGCASAEDKQSPYYLKCKENALDKPTNSEHNVVVSVSKPVPTATVRVSATKDNKTIVIENLQEPDGDDLFYDAPNNPYDN
jgi:hypothetical protein